MLRHAVYVGAENRINGVADFSETFDRWDEHARYILAYVNDVPIGTVKVIPDSVLGLPCAEFVDLKALRALGRPVEFGHLIVRSEARGSGIGVQLMRAAFRFSVAELGATHIIADLFLDKRDTSSFYRMIGFEVLHGPYRDPRFNGAPESLLMIADIRRIVENARRTPPGKLLSYFLQHEPADPNAALRPGHA
jgi:predicted GNAT family N-acyltransferase